MQTITATDLTRNTREILDKVASRGETMVVERNHIMIAKIVPPERVMTVHQALTGLKFPLLTSEQASAWFKESREGFGETVRDPWAAVSGWDFPLGK